jgi:alpha-tubulin suppressor-like RCC1 family protein
MHCGPLSGSNMEGALGDKSFNDSKYPVRVAGGGTWASVSAGNGHTCAINTDGALFCWGAHHWQSMGCRGAQFKAYSGSCA